MTTISKLVGETELQEARNQINELKEAKTELLLLIKAGGSPEVKPTEIDEAISRLELFIEVYTGRRPSR